MLLLQATDSKCYKTYLIVMTLSVLEGCYPIASHFMCNFLYCGAIIGEDKNFKCGTDIDCNNFNKSYHTDNK